MTAVTLTSNNVEVGTLANPVSIQPGTGVTVSTQPAFLEVIGTPAAALNADLLPSTDVSRWKAFSIHVGTTAYVGNLSWQVSNDNIIFLPLNLNQPGANALVNNTNQQNVIFYGGLAYRYLRVRMTAYTSGTANAVLEFYASTADIPYTNANIFDSNGGTLLGNQDGISLLNQVGAAAGAYNSADQTNWSGRGVKVYLSITAITAGSVSVIIFGKDPVTNTYFPLLTSAAITGASFTPLEVYPGIIVAANTAANTVVPKTWRIQANVNTGPATFTVSASVTL